jgi:thiol-disulfide isomerase/thioredoxin
VLTYSHSQEALTKLPEFKLKSVEGHWVSSADFADASAVVLMILCGHCPYVQAVEDRILALAKEFNSLATFVGVCSNDPQQVPDDSPEALLQRWRAKDYGFAYLIDEDQSLAKALGAVCTPEFFVFNRQRELTYHGRLDDSWRDPSRVARRDLAEALKATLAEQPVLGPQHPSMGCSIKWKRTP